MDLKCTSYLVDANQLEMDYGQDLSDKDWPEVFPVSIVVNGERKVTFEKELFDAEDFGYINGYFFKNGNIWFCIPPHLLPTEDNSRQWYLACDLSNWGSAVGCEKWQLKVWMVGGRPLWCIPVPPKMLPVTCEFKFVSDRYHWISPDNNTPMVASRDLGDNFVYDGHRTGRHIQRFRLEEPVRFDEDVEVLFSDGQKLKVQKDPWIEKFYFDGELGAIAHADHTIFRLFAPRAKAVRLFVYKYSDQVRKFDLEPYHDGVWQIKVIGNLYHYRYFFKVKRDKSVDWGQLPEILDPYARACVGSEGPGVIVPVQDGHGVKDIFQTPLPTEMVILEGHVRDFLKKAPVHLSDASRLSLDGLTKWLRHPRNYLVRLGINALELQPIQEFDHVSQNEYHWGYMPVNWFSVSTAYSPNGDPLKSIKSLKKLVQTCHHKGIAVILDVVFNHFGNANHLFRIDPEYYFRHQPQGELSNYSGCGNDIKTENKMVQKMIIDSCEYFVKTYRVDGFRLDLAELLGLNFIDALQKRLKLLKNSVVLIAEPWSFHRNIGTEMKTLSCSSWNDEYREFVKKYLLGDGNTDGLRYFLCGSLDFRTEFPGQSVNYIASHDDRGWVDNITENSHYNGSAPTLLDARRTRMAFAVLMMSVGVPMMTAGMDFLSSKNGHSNTYNNGDLNALDYERLEKYKDTHRYFRRFIRFRLSKCGEVLRLSSRPRRGYFQFFPAEDGSSAAAMLFNADRTFLKKKLIFAINPHPYRAKIKLLNVVLTQYKLLANEDVFFSFSKKFSDVYENETLELPAYSCRLYIEKC